MPKANKTIWQRFWEKVDIPSRQACWEWQACIMSGGYGQFRFLGKLMQAHRVLLNVPEGLECDHLCRNRKCVNPAHIEFVTSRENTLRGIGPAAQNAKRIYCKHGHPLCGGNLRIDRDGNRGCKTCNRIHARNYRRKRKEKCTNE